MNVIPSSDVSDVEPSRFQVQYHLICVDGRRIDEDQWRLKIGLRGQRRVWLEPTNHFIQRLWEIDVPAKRVGNNLLIAEGVKLPHEAAGLCHLLESRFPADEQGQLCLGGKEEVAGTRAVKRVWIGAAA